MDLDEKQAEIGDLRKLAQSILDALDNAESCETESDFVAEARANAKQLIADAKGLL